MKTILIVDDHPLMANATKELLKNMNEIGDIHIAFNGKEGIEKARLYRPDLIIMDYYLQDMIGTEAAKEILSQKPDSKILFMSGLDIMSLLPKIFDIRAYGALSKEMEAHAIKNAVSCILSGLMVFPYCPVEKLPSSNDVVADLSTEEVYIMKELMSGCTYEQIAGLIHMSRRTVDNYTKKIFEKLGAKNKSEAVERFMRTKYYDK